MSHIEGSCGSGIFILKTNSSANDGTFEYRFVVTTMEDFNLLWWDESVEDYKSNDDDNVLENARIKYASATVYTDLDEVTVAAQSAWIAAGGAGGPCNLGIQIHPFDRVF